jgi:hypothetical protein
MKMESSSQMNPCAGLALEHRHAHRRDDRGCFRDLGPACFIPNMGNEPRHPGV